VEDAIGYIMVMGILFIGLPWIILHYVTRWKTAATLTSSDENLMEDLYDLARRLEDRMGTVERILTAENPNWRQVASDPLTERLAVDAPPARHLESRTVSNEPARRISQ
jgi:phage shock protein B